MSIYITGDTHGDFRRFSADNFPEGKILTKEDYVIICGDFGGIWDVKKSSPQEKYWLDWLDNKPWTTLFCDGNHENFDRLNSLPVEHWNNGNVHIIRPSIFHLMRGEKFIIDNCHIFVYGGASSHDIEDGILDRKNYQTDATFKAIVKKYKRHHKKFRINHISWWEEEVPNIQEYEYALDNLRCQRTNNFLITHEASAPILSTLVFPYTQTSFEIYDFLRYGSFDKHYFGHYHINQDFGKSECVYDIIKKIW